MIPNCLNSKHSPAEAKAKAEKTQNLLNCLIIEDEPLAAMVLEDYIRQTPWLRFAGRCSDAVQAQEALQQQAVEVLFLDIHLPGVKGLDFLRSLDPQLQTILTTAYDEYAIETWKPCATYDPRFSLF